MTAGTVDTLEKQLLREATGGAEPRLCVRSRTRIDVGRWWRPKRAWVCVAGDELLMLAVARRRYMARKPLAECRGSYYCHATGELVIEPGEDLDFPRFRMSPKQALDVLTELQA